MRMGGKLETIGNPGGIKLGDSMQIDGKRGGHIKQGRKSENLLPEQIVECITGKQVAAIIFRDDCRL